VHYLVTGGAGFIGSHYVTRLVSRKLQGQEITITVLDNLTYASDLGRIREFMKKGLIKFHKVDISDTEAVAPIFGRPDVVVNFAAETHVDNSIVNPNPFMTSNLFGVMSLLNLCMTSPATRFVQVSTDEVYGSLETLDADETFPLLPNSPYAASKASADLLVRSYVNTYGLDAVITRCCNNYGPHQHQEKFIPMTLAALSNGTEVRVYGDGQNIREWIHVSDHLEGIDLAIKHGEKGEIYNLGTSERKTNLEIVAALSAALGLQSPPVKFVEDRKGHDRRYALNSCKAIQELGFRPKVSLESGIDELARTWTC